jgi:hypothetical protein
MAYGRDKHDDHYLDIAAKEASGEQLTLPEELARLRHDLEALEKRGELSGGTQAIRDRLARLESHATQAPRTSEGAR